MATLYIDSDGTGRGTHVIVIGEDGSYLGELKTVKRLKYSVEVNERATVELTVTQVPGRFIADQVLISELESAKKPWWRRLKP